MPAKKPKRQFSAESIRTDKKRIEIERVELKNGLVTSKLVRSKGEAVLGSSPQVERVLASFIHFSDIHICDTQSPARLEFLDRLADPDHPMQPVVKYIGTYRPQEFLTVQVAEAMVAAANAIQVGPLVGAPIDAVIVTGDVTDNAQHNELTWYKTVLDGGPLQPSSGHLEHKFYGPAGTDPEIYDDHYYHPDTAASGMIEDRPKAIFGVPAFDGLLEASRQPFIAAGLDHKWFGIHGNHDALLQGTAVPNEWVRDLVVGDQKLDRLSPFADLQDFFGNFGEVGPATYGDAGAIETRKIEADPRRRFSSIDDWVHMHTGCGHDHGLDERRPNQAYFSRDVGTQVRLVALDTVNEHGGWQGCLSREQFEWLERLLDFSTDKYIVLASHHPLQDLFNGWAPSGVPTPALRDEVEALLAKHPNVILWAAGHVHDNHVEPALAPNGEVAFWQVRAASLIDWPQQGRTIEIVRSTDGRVAIGTVVFDHAGPLDFDSEDDWLNNPVNMAGASRLIAANDWQRQAGDPGFDEWTGSVTDRNRWLWLADPFADPFADLP